MNLTLYLMRHGETEKEAPWRFLGQRDVPLSEEGRRQAAWWRGALEGVKFAGAWCSDLERCRDTARIILEGRGVTPVGLPGLREISLGEWDGLSVDEVRRRYPGQYEARGAAIAEFRPPGGESFVDLSERAWAALQGVMRSLREHEDANVLVVAHAGVNRTLLCRILDMPLDRLFGLAQSPCCLNIVEFANARPHLTVLDQSPGLAGS